MWTTPDPAALLAWYDRHRRHLPWRRAPGEPADPYQVWLSEIMLQQTTVKAVGPYYAKFLARWPDVDALAAAPLDDVLKAWAGLGYYARARNLHACAKAVASEHGGDFPDTEDGLRTLPGIGAYTAAAIAAIAFDRRAVAVDGNIERVIARLYRDRGRIAGGQGGNPRAGRGAGAATARRRFRPGDDGPRRHHLHAEEAGLRHLPVDGRLRGARARRRRDVSAQGAEGRRPDAPRRVVRGDARRRHVLVRTRPDEGPARRHDRGAVNAVDA